MPFGLRIKERLIKYDRCLNQIQRNKHQKSFKIKKKLLYL